MTDTPVPTQTFYDAYNAAAGKVTIPTTPPRALLVSMAMRLYHDFSLDKPDLGEGVTTFGICGFTQREREVVLADMAKVYEEVVGKGFYHWDQGADQRGGFYAL